MATGGVTIRILGLPEVNAALHKFGDGLDDEMRDQFGPMVSDAVGRIRSEIPHLTGAAAASVDGSGNTVTIGGDDAPYAPWLDFGGNVGRDDNISRPYVRGGRYLYPSLADDDRLTDAGEKAIEVQGRKQGFEVRR